MGGGERVGYSIDRGPHTTTTVQLTIRLAVPAAGVAAVWTADFEGQNSKSYPPGVRLAEASIVQA